MSLRKIAGLLAAFGLMIGLIGGGVSAVFQDQVKADQNITVGAVSCEITDAQPAGPGMVIAPDKKSVSYTPATITSSAPNATGLKFDFTVKNTGTIPANFAVDSPNTQGSQFATYAPSASGPNPVAPNASITYSGAGVTWADLTIEEGKSYTFTWKVNCTEVPAPVTIVHTQTGVAGTGWYGWSCPAGSTIVSGSVDTALVVDGPAKPGSTVDGSTYPVFPHYTYTPPEQGWVVHNNGGPATQVLTIVCQP